MEEASVILERHEQRINTLERDISDLKAVQTEMPIFFQLVPFFCLLTKNMLQVVPKNMIAECRTHLFHTVF